MASSSYYYNLYKKKRNEVEDYEDNLKDLTKALSKLNDLFDEIWDVNNELDSLIADLTKGVRHNARFSSRAHAFAEDKEKSVGADRDLSKSQNALEDEIARLTKLKLEAISDRDYYQRKYREKLDEERAEMLNKILQGGGSL